ncbi:MAG: family ATPase [Candidatus Brocadiaceae bacterium]|nr:family ATPase [Candidatus Brocadiaceae bacterium]
MATQIALFNHKGGVSKTTTTFNLGWMLANKGKKVIIIDCDSQCNLTGMVLGFKDAKEFNVIYNAKEIRNIREGLAPAFESRPVVIQPVVCETIEGQPNMYLLPGHIGLAEYEVTLGIAQELTGSLVTLQNLPGSLSYLFNITAKKYGADILLIDMSPSLGAINQNLLMTSDYFIIPMAPDYFSVMAIDSLASVLPKWNTWAKQAKKQPILQNATYPFPNKNPKFLGTIIQKYRLREGKTPSAAFQQWIDEIEKGVSNKLIPMLKDNGMLLPDEVYKTTGLKPNRPLIQMSDFNSLIALSQKHKAPIFDLTDAQLESTGVVLKITKKSMHQFRDLYSEGADRIIKIIGNA